MTLGIRLAVHPPSYFPCLPPPLLHLLLLFPPSVSSKTAQDTSILVGSQQDRFGPLTCSLSSLLPYLSLSLPVSTSFTRVFTWRRGQWRQQKKEMRDLAMSKGITGTSVRRVWTPPSSLFLFLKCTHPTQLLPSHAVFVVAALGFNELRLLVYHCVTS